MSKHQRRVQPAKSPKSAGRVRGAHTVSWEAVGRLCRLQSCPPQPVEARNPREDKCHRNAWDVLKSRMRLCAAIGNGCAAQRFEAQSAAGLHLETRHGVAVLFVATSPFDGSNSNGAEYPSDFLCPCPVRLRSLCPRGTSDGCTGAGSTSRIRPQACADLWSQCIELDSWLSDRNVPMTWHI